MKDWRETEYDDGKDALGKAWLKENEELRGLRWPLTGVLLLVGAAVFLWSAATLLLSLF